MMAKGGYRHGKKSDGSSSAVTFRRPPPRYLEDRVTTLEDLVAGLLKIARGALEREEISVHHELAELDLKKLERAAGRKQSALQRSLKKPVKRKLRKAPR